jgi:membrane-anchored mycosin MYCP
MRPDDPRDWNGVNTVVTPAWYDEYVLTVGAVDSAGAPLSKSSVVGPWVSLAAPGTDIEGLSPRDDGLMNAVDGPENSLLVPSGTSFSTAIVSGVAALVRAKYPELSSHQVINRLTRTARPPARGVDNVVGYGIVDPVAALTWDVPGGPAQPPERLSAPLHVPPMPPERDMTPAWVAGGGLLAALAAAGVALGVAALRRSRRNR